MCMMDVGSYTRFTLLLYHQLAGEFGKPFNLCVKRRQPNLLSFRVRRTGKRELKQIPCYRSGRVPFPAHKRELLCAATTMLLQPLKKVFLLVPLVLGENTAHQGLGSFLDVP